MNYKLVLCRPFSGQQKKAALTHSVPAAILSTHYALSVIGLAGRVARIQGDRQSPKTER